MAVCLSHPDQAPRLRVIPSLHATTTRNRDASNHPPGFSPRIPPRITYPTSCFESFYVIESHMPQRCSVTRDKQDNNKPNQDSRIALLSTLLATIIMANIRWNPDNPTPFTPTHSVRGRNDSNSTPTPSRRAGSVHLPTTVYAAPPTTRHGLNSSQGVRAPHTVEGACETKQTSFEWPIRNVRELKVQLDAEADRGLSGGDSPDDEERHEVLAGDGAFFDDLSYKLHLGALYE